MKSSLLDEESEGSPSPGDVSSTRARIRAGDIDVDPSSDVNRTGKDHEPSTPTMKNVE